MKNEKIANVLNEIDDTYLAQAAAPKKRRFPVWIGAIAAVLALILTLSFFPGPQPEPTNPNLEAAPTGTAPTTRPSDPANPENPDGPQKPMEGEIVGGIDLSPLQALPDLLRAPTLPNLVQFPQLEDFDGDWQRFFEAQQVWRDSQHAQFNQPEGYADSLANFFHSSIAEFLSTSENSAYSPVNVYLAMAMLAETTDGNSRQQILDLFGVETIEALRTQAGHLWNAHYNNDGQTTLLLANSLWLDKMYTFRQETVDRLANDYYASVFGGDLGTSESNAQLQAWLNTMTGGLLEDQAKNVELSSDAVFALASTVYFKAGWVNEFSESRTADGTFHAAAGDTSVPFMHKMEEGNYYRGSNFGAIRLELSGENGMWIILPDEGATLDAVLASDEYLRLVADPYSWQGKAYGLLDIALPKFDVVSQVDLCEGLQNLGLTDIFYPYVADFTPMTPTDGLFVKQINHAARVVIDEKGVVAAAFTVIEGSTESVPPAVIPFTADRPFLFIVSSQDNLPMFAGTVINP